MLENDIINLLLADTGVQTAMSSATPNIWLGAIPMGQPDSPAVVIRLPYTETYNTASGPVNMKRKRLQFDSYDTKYTNAITISAAIRAVLTPLAGTITNLNTTTVYGVLMQNEMDMPQETGDSGYVLRRTFLADVFFAE